MLHRMMWILSMALASSAPAHTFSRMVVFGDSLSDVGNVHSATFGITPASPPHFNGRFTNGPVWAERLAQQLELPGLVPSRSGGLNFAHGGVTSATGNTFFFPFFLFPNAGAQVNSFLASNTPQADDLFVLWAGGNDFLDGQTNVNAVVNNIAARVTTLANAGAKNILVANLPRLGEIPRFNANPTNRSIYNNRIVDYNAALASRINTLDAGTPANLWYLDVGARFDAMLASPTSFGFANVTQQALVNGVVNPIVSQYLFWDDVHPTAPAHAILGDAAFEVMTERRSVPSTSALAWASESTWSRGLTPDRFSDVVLSGAVAVEADQFIRRLNLNAQSLAFVLGADAPTLTASESIHASGTILLASAPAFVPLPGSVYSLFSAASIAGTPTLANATGLAGLGWEPVVSATSLAARAVATPGDADLDATVGFSDLLSLAQAYGSTGVTWLSGDFTGDGSAGFDDLLLLAQNYTSGALEADWTLARSVVPEPSALTILLAGSVLLRRR